MDKKTFKFHHYDDQFFPVRPERLSRMTSEMKEDTYWKVTISQWSEQRTHLQNNAFHGPVIEAVVDQTGYEPWEAKEEMIRLFAPVKTYVNMEGQVEEKRKRTSEMNVQEFTEFLEAILRWLAQFFGVSVDIDPALRTSGLEPRVPDGPQHHPQWTPKLENQKQNG